MESIVRNPDSRDFSQSIESDSGIDVPLETRGGKFLSPRDKFLKRLAEEQYKATKAHLPFAAHAARAYVEDLNRDLNNQLKRQGYIKEPKNIDWSQYSDLKNFDIVEEGTQYSKGDSDKYKLPIYVKWKKYKFKGFDNYTYTVMEDTEEAVKRAQVEVEEASTKRMKAVLKEAK